jgi:hypothetical protein
VCTELEITNLEKKKMMMMMTTNPWSEYQSGWFRVFDAFNTLRVFEKN